MNERIKWIDSAKGFGIFCVTLGHLSPNFYVEKYIYSFHMSLFFFLAGFLYKRRKLVISIKRQTMGLFVPFILWDALSSCLYLIKGNGIRYTLEKFCFIDGSPCWNAPIWFLLVLFLTEVMYSLILTIWENKYAPVVVMIASAILFIFINKYALPCMIDLIPFAMLLYSCGNIAHQYIYIYIRNTSAIYLYLVAY